MKRAALVVAALALQCKTALAVTDAVAPVAGQYSAEAYIAAVNDQSACLLLGGSTIPVLVSYGGLSGKLMQARIPSAPSLAGVMSVTNIVMPIKTGVGTTKPGGTLALTLTNTDTTVTGKGTFTSTIYPSTANTFLIDLHLSYQITGLGHCTAEIQAALAKS